LVLSINSQFQNAAEAFRRTLTCLCGGACSFQKWKDSLVRRSFTMLVLDINFEYFDNMIVDGPAPMVWLAVPSLQRFKVVFHQSCYNDGLQLYTNAGWHSKDLPPRRDGEDWKRASRGRGSRLANYYICFNSTIKLESMRA
jgi:hypothetical protein